MNWRALRSEMIQTLRAHGVEDAGRQASLILQWACGRPLAWWVVHDGELTGDEVGRARQATRRRAAHEPWAYISGYQEFYGLTLAVSPDVLIPRPETEILVEQTLQWVPAGARVVDVGTGSGAIALALKHARPDLDVVGVDISPAALNVARSNGQRLNLSVQWVHSDLLSAVPGRFDCIVANLPYVEEDFKGDAELGYEPRLALYAGRDGLDVIRRLIGQVPKHLGDHGRLILECGWHQADTISEDLRERGFSDIRITRDYQGLSRVVEGCLA